MKGLKEIETKVLKLTDEVNDLHNKQSESSHTQAVASLQEIINCKKHAISMLKWVINSE